MVSRSLAIFALLAGPGQVGAHGRTPSNSAVSGAHDSSSLLQVRGDGDVADDVHLHPTPKGRTTWGGDLLVYPAKKLVFCSIPKNACTQFMRIFLGLNHQVERAEKAETWKEWFNLATLQEMGMTVDQVSRSKGYKWAVFLRDPLSRYLSAWGSKCVQKEDTWSCIGDMFSDTGSVEDFEKHVLAVSRDPKMLYKDLHWAPQQSMCGGLNSAKDYDFVGKVGEDTQDTNSQVHAMLKMVGAPENEVDDQFPLASITGHHSSLKFEDYYRNETIRRLVRGFYRDDYALPGLA